MTVAAFRSPRPKLDGAFLSACALRAEQLASSAVKTILALLFSAALAWGGSCKGDKDCAACRTCAQCEWCNSGKSPCGVKVNQKRDLVDVLAGTLVNRVVEAFSAGKAPRGITASKIKRELARAATVAIVNKVFSSDAPAPEKAKQAKRDLVDVLVECMMEVISSGKTPNEVRAEQKTRERMDALVDILLASIADAMLPGTAAGETRANDTMRERVDSLVKRMVDSIPAPKKN